MPSKRREIRKFAGLVDYLDLRLGTHRGSGPEYQFWCPACLDRMGSESSGRRFWFNTLKLKGRCWRCNYRVGNIQRLFRYLNGGVLRREELAFIKGEIAPVPETSSLTKTVLEILYTDEAVETLAPVKVPGEMIELAPLTQCQRMPAKAQPAFNYLKRRGISHRQIVKHQIGYCPTGRYAMRLIFPVIQGGEQVYFSNRSILRKTNKKTLNPSEGDGASFTAGRCILNYDGLVGAKIIELVEGSFDMMAFAHAGAMLGKTMTGVQASLIEALVPHGLKEVVVAVDAGAVKEAQDIGAKLLGRVPKVSFLDLNYGDPDERRKEIKTLLSRRKSRLSLADRVRATQKGKKRPRVVTALKEPKNPRRSEG